MKAAFLDAWAESERGWGQRGDGCTIHLTREDYNAFVKAYWDRMPDEVQDEYTRPDNCLREAVLSDEIYKKLEESENGIRFWQSEFNEKKKENEILFKD